MTNEIVLSRTLVSTERLHLSSRESLAGSEIVGAGRTQEISLDKTVRNSRSTQDILNRSDSSRSIFADKRPQSWTSTSNTNCENATPTRSRSMFMSFRKRCKGKKKRQTDKSDNDRYTDIQTDRQTDRGYLTSGTSEEQRSDSRPASLVSEGRPASMTAADQRTSVCTTSSGASSHSTPSSGNNGYVLLLDTYLPFNLTPQTYPSTLPLNILFEIDKLINCKYL